MIDKQGNITVTATSEDSGSAYRVPVGSEDLSEGESREIICSKWSHNNGYAAVLADSMGDSESIHLFVFENEDFAYSYTLPVTSEMEMTPNYSVDDIALHERDWHLSVANNGSVGIVIRYEPSAANALDLSSLPEAPQSESETALVVMFDSGGTPVVTEPFVTGVHDLDISRDGDYFAVLTSFPDIQTYLYKTDGEYLGSWLGKGTEQHCSFIQPGKPLRIELSGANMSKTTLDVAEEFGAVMPGDSRLVQDAADGPIHIILPESLPDSTENLRLGDIEVESACGTSMTPISSHLIFDSQREADEAEASLCADCSDAVGVAEKFEERIHDT